MKCLKASTMALLNAIVTNTGLKCNRFLIKVCGLNNWIITIPTFCRGKRNQDRGMSLSLPYGFCRYRFYLLVKY